MKTEASLPAIILSPFLVMVALVTANNARADTPVDIAVGAPTFEVIEPSRSAVVIPEKELAAKNPPTLADALREVPGVEVVRQGGVGQTTSLFIRGARSEDTLVLVDGAELNDAISPGGGYDFSSFSPINIARIEVYRGPQAVRFGAGALGGVVNIITKEGGGPASLAYAGEAGSFRTNRQAVSGRAAIGNIGVAAGAERFANRGFSAARFGAEPDGAKLGSGSLKLSWAPSATAKVMGTLRLSENKVDTDRGGGPANDDPNAFARSRQLAAGLFAETWLMPGFLRSNFGFYFARLSRADRNDPDERDASSSFGDFLAKTYRLQSETEFVLGDRHLLRLNLQARRETGEARTRFFGTDSELPPMGQSVFGQALTYLYETPTWFGDLGVRHDAGSAAAAAGSFRASAGRYFPGVATKLTLTYGTGLKPASLYQRYSVYGDPNLHPEKSGAFEITLERRLGMANSVALAAFANDYRELIDYNTATNRYFNLTRARSRGFELRGRLRGDSPFSAELAYSFLSAQDAITGLALVRRPRHSVESTLRYARGAIESRAAFRFRGARPDVDPVTFARVRNPAYGLVDLYADYSFSRGLKAGFALGNVFNKSYEEVAGYGTAGRNFTFRLRGEI